eukprot:6915884-Alexandrium_andersonii.AAC.1
MAGAMTGVSPRLWSHRGLRNCARVTLEGLQNVALTGKVVMASNNETSGRPSPGSRRSPGRSGVPGMARAKALPKEPWGRRS